MSVTGQDVQILIQDFKDANAVRYFSTIGIIAMLYDHTITFSEEVRCVWKAPNKFPKFAWLVNRYIVVCAVVAIMHELCGFSPGHYTDQKCRDLLSVTTIIGVTSVNLSNLLALLRTLIIWQDSKLIRWFLYAIYAFGTIVTTVLITLTVVTLRPGIRWAPDFGMCIVTSRTEYLGAAYGGPLFFELAIISAIVLNTMATPRSASMKLTKALQRDGLAYFTAVVALRLFNLILAMVARTSLTLLGNFFVLAAVNLVSNRYVLHLRQVEIKHLKSDPSLPGNHYHNRAASPFWVPGEAVQDDQLDEEEDEEDANSLEFSKPAFNQLYPLTLNLSIIPSSVTHTRYGCHVAGDSKVPSGENSG